jgi:dTDP-4-dehydrorhamnose 3,5-epimerase
MRYKIEETFIQDVKIITSPSFYDKRGFFIEVFNKKDFEEMSIPCEFLQMNHSLSVKNVIRGLHFQWDPPMGKLMRVINGSAFLIAVDIRKNSPTLGKWYGKTFVSPTEHLWAPAGFARGICSLENATEVQYLITGAYNPINESEIIWNDLDININWPIKDPIVSSKDKNAQSFKEWLASENSNNFM